MKDLVAAQDNHAERLRRLALRTGGGPADVTTPGFTGAFARTLGAQMSLAVGTEFSYDDFSAGPGGTGFLEFPMDPDPNWLGVIDERFRFGVSAYFERPTYIDVTVNNVSLWEGLHQQVFTPDINTSTVSEPLSDFPTSFLGFGTSPWQTALFGTTGTSPYSASLRFPRQVLQADGAFEAPGLAAFVGAARNALTLVVRFTVHWDDLAALLGVDLNDPVQVATLPRLSIDSLTARYGQDRGLDFEQPGDQRTVYWDTLVAASEGFALGSDNLTITIPPGVGGWYRAVGGAVITETPSRSTGDFSRGRVQIAATGSGLFEESSLPATAGSSAARASALFEVPDEGGTAALWVFPAPEVGSLEEVTGARTDHHIEEAHLGVWRWFQ